MKKAILSWAGSLLATGLFCGFVATSLPDVEMPVSQTVESINEVAVLDGPQPMETQSCSPSPSGSPEPSP
jgi:hypothetical protein